VQAEPEYGVFAFVRRGFRQVLGERQLREEVLAGALGDGERLAFGEPVADRFDRLAQGDGDQGEDGGSDGLGEYGITGVEGDRDQEEDLDDEPDQAAQHRVVPAALQLAHLELQLLEVDQHLVAVYGQ
jgi:hypothetical protein